MMRQNMPSKNKGVTLIELLIALGISSILVAALYRTFIGQQKTYIVQDQVVDMQQNVRVAINKMMRDVRMAGFGNVGDLLGTRGIENGFTGEVNSFTQVITPNANSITIVGGFRQISTLDGDAAARQKKITLKNATDASQFDGAIHHYISVVGLESNTVQSRTGAELTLNQPLKVAHAVGTPIFKIHAITYGVRDDNGTPVLFRDLYSNTTSSKRETVAENIENVQFEYFDGANPPNLLTLPIADPTIIRMVRVTVTARTSMNDPDYKGGVGGYRRRQITSNIQVRNMSLSP
jgi:prepilin-type N-terminal cleavage/methylation domain-containing protein